MRMQRLVTLTAVLMSWSLPSHGQVYDRIAFQSSRDADHETDTTDWEWEIYSMNTDGSDQVNLTNSSGQDIDPAWSPDGTKIAFASNRTGSFQIFVMDADGSNQVQLTRQPGDHLWPAWSPDGSQLAYSSDNLGALDIYVMQATGDDPVNITQSSGQDYAPSWSPDGTRIAFSSDRDRIPEFTPLLDPVRELWIAPNDIFVMDALGGGATNLTFTLKVYRTFSPVWSPMDESIAYIVKDTRPEDVDYRSEDIVVIGAGGGGELRLGLPAHEFFTDLRSLSWSRDASQLAFSSRGDVYGWQIHVMPGGGGRPSRLTDPPGMNVHPTWSPMSKKPGSTQVDQTTWGVVKQLFVGDAEESAD